MFGPWIEGFGWLQAHTPAKLSALKRWKPKMTFITLHYTYIITMTLLGSVLLYPAGGMAYVDALFFGSGAATQSGLNTIDVNLLSLYQQIVIMLIACVCNPIFINTFVVFIRLYWFEKRFQNVVLEARSLRKTRTRSRTKSEAKADMDRKLGDEENGVGDRQIVVLRNENGRAKGKKIEDETMFEDGYEMESNPENSGSARDTADDPPADQDRPPFHRDITFADELKPATTPEERLPTKRSKEHSIEFVQNQRNPKDRGALRIPGPRDFELGFVPERIEEGDEPLEKEATNEEDSAPRRLHRASSVPPSELNGDDHPMKSHITIDVPNHPRPTTGPSAYSRMPRSAEEETPTAAMHLRNRTRTKTVGSFMTKGAAEEHDPMPYLSWTPTVGRNSAFVDLTEEQREELGGIEYRSLKLLAIILVFYYVGFHLLGMVCLLPWIVRDKKYSKVVEDVNVKPVWWGFFTPASMFNDLGITLTPDSMVSFQLAVLPLLLGTFLIIIGNTGFPCMLRFVIWLASKAAPFGSGVWEELRFLLDHPRRCFTLLFPSTANWWLFGVLILFNGIDVILFIILDLHNPVVTNLHPGLRFLAGLFQAASTRTAGFSVVNIAALHPATQVSYLIMMYISIFPIAMSLRRTNVYEEKSLGVWGNSNDDQEGNAPSSYLGTHMRRQLSFDLWYVFLGFFLIAIVEGSRLENTNDYTFTLFSVLFEIISAYGTVGLSLGYPGINTSFSGEFKTLSKLIIIAMQIRGRHRGLPYALDRAILLPSESLHRKEDEDAARWRANRRNSMSVNDDIGDLPTVGGAAAATDGGAVVAPEISGLSRTGTGASGLSAGQKRKLVEAKQVRRFLYGALGAGPTIPRDQYKRA